MYDLCLLLGGTGSRMKMKAGDNKHIQTVGGKSVLAYIKDKIDEYEQHHRPFENKWVVTNSLGVEEIMRCLGQSYIYFYQEAPTGVPDAMAIPPIKNSLLLHLGDQFYQESLDDFMEGFEESTEIGRVWIKFTSEACHHTALLGDEFVEKPDIPAGHVCTGLYLLRPEALGLVTELPRHTKGENNMADLMTKLKKRGRIGAKEMTGYWLDLGKPEAFDKAERLQGAT